MVCPECLKIGIKIQMKIEKDFDRCVLCKHRVLKGKEDGTTEKVSND